MKTEPLTVREAQVLQLLAWGYTTLEVGENLGITVSTVKNHLANSGLKLNTRGTNRTATVTEALRRGIISVGAPSPLGQIFGKEDT